LENSRLQKKAVYSMRQLLKIAAIFILVFFLGGLTSKLIFTRNTTDNKVCEISTPLGSKTHLVLPDGSQVWLNAGSKLTYPRSFDDKERKVALVGEAFFKVQTNKSKPFIVSTGQMNVRALGTAFNVKAYPEDKAITTTLVEGIVKVDGVQGKKQFSYTLKPNQNIILNKEAEVIHEKVVAVSKKSKAVDIEPSIAAKVEIKTKVKTELFTSWKDSRWTIEGESLRSLAILLERKYNIIIHIDSYELDKYKFTGTIQNETLEQVLQFLSYTTPLEYEIGKGEVWWNIDRKKEQQYSKILNKTR
jgi:ferric-dicitrate binding protein FerR (iron transport regulator)